VACARTDQVLAIVVEQVDVVLGHGRRQACAHFTHEHLVPQPLRRADFVEVPRPRHFNPFARRRRLRRTIRMARAVK